MSKIQATIIADSTNPQGDRITTMMVTFPRFILAELNTHRMFSRNSASSRAIPFEKMLESVEKDPFIPIAWQKDHKGMQGTEYITDPQEILECRNEWLFARDQAIFSAEILSERNNVTKQLCNRLLEPFMWHTVLVTSTEWDNFFQLRSPQYKSTDTKKPQFFKSKKDWMNYHSGHEGSTFSEEFWQDVNKGQAEIHMMGLAEAMWDAMNESSPKELQPGEWHIPFGDNINAEACPIEKRIEGKTIGEKVNDCMIKIATARCARVSYTVVGEEDKTADYQKDIQLHDRLLQSGHFSPFEHCAKAMNDDEYHHNVKGIGTWDGKSDALYFNSNERGWRLNYKGFIQYRALIS